MFAGSLLMNLAAFNVYLSIQKLFVYSENTAGVRLPPAGPACKDTFLPKLQPYVDMLIREGVGEKEGQEMVCPSICYRILRQLAEEEAAQDMRHLQFTDYAKIRDYCGRPLRCEDYSGVFEKEVRAFGENAESQCGQEDVRALRETNLELQGICEAEHGCTWSAANARARRIENKRRGTPFPYDQYACKCDKHVYLHQENHLWGRSLDALVKRGASSGIEQLVACDGSATATWCKCGELPFGCAPQSCRNNQCLSRTIVLFLQNTPNLGECSEEGMSHSLLQINKELCRTSRTCGFRVDLVNTKGNNGVLLTCRDCRGLLKNGCDTMHFCDWHETQNACLPRGMKVEPLFSADQETPNSDDDDHCRISSLGSGSFVSNNEGSQNCEALFGCVGEGSFNCIELCPSKAVECIAASSRCRFNTGTRRCEGPIGSCATFEAHCSRVVQREWCRVQATRFTSASTSLPSDCFLQAVSTRNVPNDLNARIVKQSVETSRQKAFEQTRARLKHYCERWSPATASYGCTSDRVVQVQTETLARAELRKSLFGECERLKKMSPFSMLPRMTCDKTHTSQRVMLEVINRQRRFEYHRTRLSEMLAILSEPLHRWPIDGIADVQYGSYNIDGAEQFMALLTQLGGHECFPSSGGLPDWISDYYVHKMDTSWIPEWLNSEDWPWQEHEKRALWEDLRQKPWSHMCLEALADEMMRLLNVAGKKTKVKLARKKKKRNWFSWFRKDRKKEKDDDRRDLDDDEGLEQSSGRTVVLSMVERLLDTFVMRATTFPFSHMVELRDMALVICREDSGYVLDKNTNVPNSTSREDDPDVVSDLEGCARGLTHWVSNTSEPSVAIENSAEAMGWHIGEELGGRKRSAGIGRRKDNDTTNKNAVEAHWSPKLAIQFLKSLLIAHDRTFPFLLQDEEIHEKIFALYVYLVRSEEYYTSPREHKVFGRFISLAFPEAVLESFLNLVSFLSNLHNLPLILDHGYLAASKLWSPNLEEKDEFTQEYERLLRRSSQHVPLFMSEFLRKDGSHWFFEEEAAHAAGDETEELRDAFAVPNDNIILHSPVGGDKSVIDIIRDQKLPFPQYDIRILLFFKFNWHTFMSKIGEWPPSLLVHTNDYYINRIRQNKMIEQFVCDLLKRQKNHTSADNEKNHTSTKDEKNNSSTEAKKNSTEEKKNNTSTEDQKNGISTEDKKKGASTNDQTNDTSTKDEEKKKINEDEKKTTVEDLRRSALAVTPYFPNYKQKSWPMWKHLPQRRCAAMDLVDLLLEMPEQSRRRFRRRGNAEEDEDSELITQEQLQPSPRAAQRPVDGSASSFIIASFLILFSIAIALGAYIWQSGPRQAELGGNVEPPGRGGGGGPGAPGDADPSGLAAPWSDEFAGDEDEVAPQGPRLDDEWTDGRSDDSGNILEDHPPAE